jgi:hypothetical protein
MSSWNTAVMTSNFEDAISCICLILLSSAIGRRKLGNEFGEVRF